MESADVPRQRLTDLRNGLLKLHKILMDSERSAYERDIARVTSSWHMLDLVLHDPWFAWLHDLSGLVVEIDERLAAKEPATGSEANRLVAQARRLLRPAEAGRRFESRYFDAMQRDPDVVLGHAEMSRLLSKLEGK